MIKIRRLRKNRRSDRGSALLVSLMVIVGLSLLGLGFVAISETESAIAKNQQNALATQAIAEAGAKVVVEWFQDPSWGETQAALPVNASAPAAIKPTRYVGGNPACTSASPGNCDYAGSYKPDVTKKLLDKPYRPSNDNRFFGNEDHADLVINRTTAPALIDAFNDKLLASNGATATGLDKLAGEVTEIKIFAPPIVGGTVNAAGYWSSGSRYGLATIKVTAQQFRDPGAHTGVIASHSVRLVVGELPLPIPAGPIQGNANVSFGGNFRVHWGMETSQGDLVPSLNLTSLPWANAYERPHFEHGYEQGTSIASISITAGGSGYTAVPTVTLQCNAPCAPGGSGFSGTVVLAGGVVSSVTIPAAGHGTGYNLQFPPQVVISAPPAGGTQATAVANVAAEIWPTALGSTYDDQDYFHELLAKDFQDPFYGARAFRDNSMDGAGGPTQCFPYQYTADEQSNSTPSYAFQYQDANSFPTKKKVVFPTIIYAYWKRIAQAGRGYRGIYYFKYDSPGGAGGLFTKFGIGTPQAMPYWVNTQGTGAHLGAGVYFFDTTNGADPQQMAIGSPGRATALTPQESWQSNDFGGNMLMQGFVYANASSFGTTGQGNNATTIQANFPGEPFRDVGYPVWDEAAGNWSQCGGQICRRGIGDAAFSCQTTMGGNADGRCHIVVMRAPTWTSTDNGAPVTHTSPWPLPQCGSGCSGGHDTYVEKVWKSRDQAIADYGQPCTVPLANVVTDGTASSDCSFPHEPYLNLIYPDQGANNNGAPYSVVVGWEQPSQTTYRPKTTDSQGAVIPCPAPGTIDYDKCTSDAYDVDGAVVPLDVILDGILYNEGQWGSEGNAWFFGSILIRDTINLSSGTADVWFDEKLLKGTWAPPGMPRVIVFSEQTDEQTQ